MLNEATPARISRRIRSVTDCKEMETPSSSTFREFLRFIVWASGVDHRQFSGEYPSLFFIRSRDVPIGLGPISFKKLKNPSGDPHHLSATVTPWYSRFALHRWCIAFHELNSGVPLEPCDRPLYTHPQFSECPSRNDDASTERVVPHSHRHIQYVAVDLDGSLGSGAAPITNQPPNWRPEILINLPIVESFKPVVVIPLYTEFQ